MQIRLALALLAALASGCHTLEETRFINFDAESVGDALTSGFSTFESRNGETFVWSADRVAKLNVYSRADGDRLVRVRWTAFSFDGAPVQTATLLVYGARTETTPVETGAMTVHTFKAPQAMWARGPNELRFDFAYAESPRNKVKDSTDARNLSVAFDWLEIVAPLVSAN
jgi:hypothetical protein